ncbi:Guanylate-binding protein 1 [Varanus komodoensis]|nr:Guanylate-binding protein 1 [Varanus komodoensis]
MDGLEDSAEFVRFFPDFIWSLRDFTLCLELDGQPITADDYLEHALTLKQGDTPAIEKCNLPRKCIQEFFPTRKCFIFERPTSKKNLSRLDQMQESELDPDFVEQAAQFCNYVYRTSKAKTIPGGHVLNGRLLANLAKTYVDTIQNGRVPCLENAVLALAKIENPAAVAEATARYVELMEQWLNLPTETLEELLEIHAGCEEEALRVFRARAFKDDTHEFQAQLKNTLDQKMEEYRKNNELESSKCCEAVLSSVCQELEEGIRNAIYAQPGGHKHFLEDLNKLEQRYRQEPNKGVMAEAILQQYFKDKEQIGTTILQCDKILTQEEQEKAEAQAKAEEAERELERQRQQLAELQQRLQDEQRRSEMSWWERMLQEFWDDLHPSEEWRNLRKMNQGKQQLSEELSEQENETGGRLVPALLKEQANFSQELALQRIDTDKELTALSMGKPVRSSNRLEWQICRKHSQRKMASLSRLFMRKRLAVTKGQ